MSLLQREDRSTDSALIGKWRYKNSVWKCVFWPTNIISDGQPFLRIRAVQAGVLQHQSLGQGLHLERVERWRLWGYWETYDGVAEAVVPGRVAPRALVGRPGVVEDEERGHGSDPLLLGVREEQTAAEGLPAEKKDVKREL